MIVVINKKAQPPQPPPPSPFSSCPDLFAGWVTSEPRYSNLHHDLWPKPLSHLPSLLRTREMDEAGLKLSPAPGMSSPRPFKIPLLPVKEVMVPVRGALVSPETTAPVGAGAVPPPAACGASLPSWEAPAVCFRQEGQKRKQRRIAPVAQEKVQGGL